MTFLEQKDLAESGEPVSILLYRFATKKIKLFKCQVNILLNWKASF